MARSVVTIKGVSKAFNDRGLREFCPEGHRVFWPAHMTAIGRKLPNGDLERGSINTGDPDYSGHSTSTPGKINRGICTAGDFWAQQRSDVTTRTERRDGSSLPVHVPVDARPRTGMEQSSAPGTGSYDVGYNLNRDTGVVTGHASLKCALNHVDQKSGRVRDPDDPAADSRGWVNRPSPTPVPDSIGEANAFISGLLAEGWELREGRLLCPKCVECFDELEHGLKNAQAVERLEHESAAHRFEYRIVRHKDYERYFNPYRSGEEPLLVEGEIVTIPTSAEIDEANRTERFLGRSGGSTVVRKANGKLVAIHPSLVKRVEIETDD